MSEKEMPKQYYVLWFIVGVLALFIFVGFGIFKVGYVGWECVEEKTTCVKCDLSETQTIVTNYDCDKQKNPNMCYCTEYKTECTKEVWTRK
jgi:hypothetical protein